MNFLLHPSNHSKFPINLSGHIGDLFGFLTKDPLLIWNNESRVKFLWGRTLVQKLLPACENQLSFCGKHEKKNFCNRRDWNIQVSAGSVTPKNLLKCMELIWYFLTGGVHVRENPWGKYGYFFETTKYTLWEGINIFRKSKTARANLQ